MTELAGARVFPWYALQVRPRFEKMVASTLLLKGYEGFLPVYTRHSRWSDRYKDILIPLFTGYLFCRFDINSRLPVLNTPGVIKIIRIGKTFYPVDESEIYALQTVVFSGLLLAPHSYLNLGQRVHIEYGPLSGLEGILTSTKGSNRLVVSVSLLHRSVSVEIDESWIDPIPFMPESVYPHVHH